MDLTRALNRHTHVIELPEPLVSPPPFSLEELSRYDARGPDTYWNVLHCGEHVGTHIDAPIHWATGRGGCDVSQIPVDHLIAPAVVIDHTAQVADDPDHLLTVEDVRRFEAVHGELPAGAWLLFRTGWGQRWEDRDAYFNLDDTGKPHWPGLSVECARWLAEETAVVGFGVETLGTDAGISGRFDRPQPFHHYFLSAGKLGLANLARLDELPATGSLLITAPLPIEDGSGSPARVLALVEQPLGEPSREMGE